MLSLNIYIRRLSIIASSIAGTGVFFASNYVAADAVPGAIGTCASKQEGDKCDGAGPGVGSKAGTCRQLVNCTKSHGWKSDSCLRCIDSTPLAPKKQKCFDRIPGSKCGGAPLDFDRNKGRCKRSNCRHSDWLGQKIAYYCLECVNEEPKSPAIEVPSSAERKNEMSPLDVEERETANANKSSSPLTQSSQTLLSHNTRIDERTRDARDMEVVDRPTRKENADSYCQLTSIRSISPVTVNALTLACGIVLSMLIYFGAPPGE